jgi:signal transduction histidine kinase/ActR/RegA family two-component response regulator
MTETNIKEVKSCVLETGEIDVGTLEQFYGKLLNEIMASSLIVYREIYFVHIESDYYRRVYPDGEHTEEFGNYSEAVKNHFRRGIIVDKDDSKIWDFLSIENLRNELRDKDICEHRYRRTNQFGTVEWCLVSFTIGIRKENVPVTATMTIRSIERMVREEQEYNRNLKEALEIAENANKAKTDFYSTVSHDMRTPLNAIIGMCTIAKLYPDDLKRIKSCIDKIETAGRYLMTLINELLDMAQIESGKLKLVKEPFSIIEMMNELFEMTKVMAFAKNVYIRYLHKEVIHANVVGDETKISQIITNIISNAVKYSYDDDEVTISMEELADKGDGKIWFRFTIADNGIGMEEDFLEKIFEPFGRIENEKTKNVYGTGLGLPIANKLVNAMGGSIDIKSRLNEGSTVVVDIPFEISECEAVKNDELKKTLDITQMAATQDKRKIKALVAEDNEMNAEIAAEILKQLGVETVIAENGKEALESIRTSPKGEYDCVFMDMRMPVMDGIESAKLIREIYDANELPIFAMTANVYTDDIAKTHGAGMQEHIGKPINIIQVKDVIDKYFG